MFMITADGLTVLGVTAAVLAFVSILLFVVFAHLGPANSQLIT